MLKCNLQQVCIYLSEAGGNCTPALTHGSVLMHEVSAAELKKILFSVTFLVPLTLIFKNVGFFKLTDVPSTLLFGLSLMGNAPLRTCRGRLVHLDWVEMSHQKRSYSRWLRPPCDFHNKPASVKNKM